MPFRVEAFYHFADLKDLARLQAEALALGSRHELLGTLILAEEGVNGTVAGSDAATEALLTWLRALPGFAQLESKRSEATEAPFGTFRVKLRPEIVTMRVPEAQPARGVGTYVEPEAWNALLRRPEVRVIDTRNAFEYQAGHFRNAEDPNTATFSQFPAFVEKSLQGDMQAPVALYCTGGIRCEKATAHLLNLGFSEVYHLKGGILRYLELMSPEQSLWEGECFVFDERVTVTHGVAEGSMARCRGCGCAFAASQATQEATVSPLPTRCPECTAQPRQ